MGEGDAVVAAGSSEEQPWTETRLSTVRGCFVGAGCECCCFEATNLPATRLNLSCHWLEWLVVRQLD